MQDRLVSAALLSFLLTATVTVYCHASFARRCKCYFACIGGFNQRHGEALPPQIFLTLSRFVFTVPTRKIGSVYSQENYRNCCHLMSDFKAKKAPNSISAGETPLGELTALLQTPADPNPGPRNNLPPKCVSLNPPMFACVCVFLPRCMECRRGLAMRIILSVRPSVKRVHCDKTEER